MNQSYLKKAGIGLLVIGCYFFFSYMEGLPFLLLGIDVNTLSNAIKIPYLLIYQVLLLLLIIAILKKSFFKDVEDLKKNHKTYFKKYFKYWFLLLGLMMLSNYLILAIMTFAGNGTMMPENEEIIRSNFQVAPIYIYLSSVVIAPLMEELVFRRGIRNIVPNNVLFILISGLVFGCLHVVLGGFQTPLELLYIIPYSIPGFIFAYVLTKTDNVLVTAVIHTFHNGILMSLQFLMLLFM